MAISPAASISSASLLQAAQARANANPAGVVASTNPAPPVPSAAGRPHHGHHARPVPLSSTERSNSSTVSANSVLNTLV